MHHECVCVGTAAVASAILVKRRESNQLVGKRIIVPEIPFGLDNSLDLPRPLIVGEAPLAASRQDQRIAGDGGTLNPVVTTNKKSGLNVLPRTVKGLTTISDAKAGGQ